MVLASKVGFKAGDRRRAISGSARGIDPDGHRSRACTRLQTDYLDLYYLHIPDWNTPIDESLEAMDRVVRAGKVALPGRAPIMPAGRWWKCSGSASEADISRRTFRSPCTTCWRAASSRNTWRCAGDASVATIIYNPLAGGLLTGKHQMERPIPGTRFDANQLYLDRYWHPAYFEAVDELKAIAAGGRADASSTWRSIGCCITRPSIAPSSARPRPSN